MYVTRRTRPSHHDIPVHHTTYLLNGCSQLHQIHWRRCLVGLSTVDKRTSTGGVISLHQPHWNIQIHITRITIIRLDTTLITSHDTKYFRGVCNCNIFTDLSHDTFNQLHNLNLLSHVTCTCTNFTQKHQMWGGTPTLTILTEFLISSVSYYY